MNILQFTVAATLPPGVSAEQVAANVIAISVADLNQMARLDMMVDDPAYVTEPFTAAVWQAKADDPTTWWLDWDAVFAALTDPGRRWADRMFGVDDSGPFGVALDRAANARTPATFTRVSSTDLIADGFLPPLPDGPV